MDRFSWRKGRRQNLPKTVDYLPGLTHCGRRGGTMRYLISKLTPFRNLATLLGGEHAGKRASLEVLKYRSRDENGRGCLPQLG